MIDTEASGRLLAEVQRLYLARTGRTKFSVLALSEWSGVTREPLRQYLQFGKFPDPDVLSQLATALGVSVNQLWSAWFRLETRDPLVRIAEALERAYPPDEAQVRADALDRLDRVPPGAEGSEAPPVPRKRAGSVG